VAEELTCPSASCEPGATLLGLIDENGRVGYLTPAITIDHEFVEKVERGRSPRKRFRFAGPCVEEKCVQWTGSRCGVIDTVFEAVERLDPEPALEKDSLPHCAIRSSCRWFAQEGEAACAACPFVITDCR
jgi:hypothetical protein